MDQKTVGPDANTTTFADRANLLPAMRKRTDRQRQIDELYDLYDLLIIERLLKRHPSPGKSKGV